MGEGDAPLSHPKAVGLYETRVTNWNPIYFEYIYFSSSIVALALFSKWCKVEEVSLKSVQMLI